MKKTYIIKSINKILGPLDEQELKDRLQGKSLRLEEYVYHIEAKEWIMLGDLEIVSDYLPSTPLENPEVKKPFLFVSIKQKISGPHTYIEVMEMVKNSLATPFEYLFVSGLNQWTTFKSIPDFYSIFENVYKKPTQHPAIKLGLEFILDQSESLPPIPMDIADSPPPLPFEDDIPPIFELNNNSFNEIEVLNEELEKSKHNVIALERDKHVLLEKLELANKAFEKIETLEEENHELRKFIDDHDPDNLNELQIEISNKDELLLQNQIEIEALNNLLIEKNQSQSVIENEKLIALNDELNIQVLELRETIQANEENYKADILKAKKEGSKDDISKLQNALSKRNEEFNTLRSKALKIKEKLENDKNIVKELKKLLMQSQHLVDEKQVKITHLENDIRTLKEDSKNVVDTQVSKHLERIKVLENELESIKTEQTLKVEEAKSKKNIDSSEDDQELLIGDMFEVPNKDIWELRMDDEVKGPFSFSELLTFQELEKIDKKTPIRKVGEIKFQKVKDIYELNTKVARKKVNIAGKIIEKFFVKRLDFRAPFHAMAVLEIEGRQVSGYCTSISLGGCFLEIPKINTTFMQKNKEAILTIKSDVFPSEIEVVVAIRAVLEKRPRGLGLQFLDLLPDQLGLITDYVENFKKKSDKAA